jgi:hypothetical protein
MTIELSLRRRAIYARLLAILWLLVATVILVGTYVSLPGLANRALSSVSQLSLAVGNSGPAPTKTANEVPTSQHAEFYAFGIVGLGVLAIGFACFLLGRTAFVEIELAARYAGIADALCLAGENLDALEKATNLLVPAAKYLSVPEIFSVNDLKTVVDTVKQIR